MDIERDPTAPPVDSPPASGSTPPTTEPWRAPADHPEPWARGKTAEEILAVANQAVGALRNLANQPSQSYAPPTSAPAFRMPEDDDVVTGSQFKQAMQMMVNGLAPVQQTQDQLAQYALNQTRSTFPKEFQKYEGEIMAQILPLPRSAWSLDNLRLAVELVAGRHRHELAQEMAREMAANQGLTLRTDGFAGTHTPVNRDLTLESEKLPADFKERLAKQGISMSTVREFCAKTGMTVEQWFKNAEKLGNSVMGGN